MKQVGLDDIVFLRYNFPVGEPKNRQVIARSHLKTEGKLLKETLGYNLLGRFEKDSICQARNDSFQIYKRNSVVSIVKIRKRVR